ncbi:MAG: DUF3821 domain-containing protein [Methanoregula sp.]|jgi:hypothetical protein
MANRTRISGIALVAILLVIIWPGAASLNAISTGNTVFIGEQGLDVRSILSSGDQIGWWASGASIAGSSPDYIVSVSDASDFYVTQSDFTGKTGSWYVLPAKTVAFIVADPYLELQVEDTTVGVDVTNKWVPTDDELEFRINSNLVQMTQRSGVSGVPVTIKVQTPDGAILSSLTGKSGSTTSLVNYNLVSTPQNTGSIWGTSNRATYPPGTYYIWVECNVNSMNDNYGQSGKTVSSKVTVLNQDRNPLIGDKSYVTNPTTFISTVTTRIPTPVTTKITTPVPTAPLLTITPATTVPTMEIPTTVETLPPATTVESTAVPTTHTPGFEAGLVIAATLFGLVFCLKKK